MLTHYLDKVFNPKAVAAIGASARPLAVGATVFTNLLQGGYQGKIFPVNPKHQKIQGEACFRSVLEIPDAIDLAIIVTPPKAVVEVLKQCGERKIGEALVMSNEKLLYYSIL